jgi:hypothetical protein
MSRYQSVRQNHRLSTKNIVTNKPYENASKFKYLRTRNQNFIHEEIKSRFKSGNACYHSVQNILSSRFIYNKVNTKICRTIILTVVLYGWETWCITQREKRSLRVFEKWVLRRIFRREDVIGGWKILHNEEVHNLHSSSMLLRLSNQGEQVSGICFQIFSRKT